MGIPAVGESWARVDAWPARPAPLTHATLRPPAPQAGIEDAERTPGVPFHPGLMASLRCHDGVEIDEGAVQLSLLRTAVRCRGHRADTTFLRDPALDAERGEDVQPLTLGIGRRPSAGLFIACRPGPRYGQVGRRFDECMASFACWPSLRHVLADLAEALEGGLPFLDRIPLAVAGKLLWEEKRTVPADAVSPLAHAATLAEPESDPPALQRPVLTNSAGSAPPPLPQEGTQRLFFRPHQPPASRTAPGPAGRRVHRRSAPGRDAAPARRDPRHLTAARPPAGPAGGAVRVGGAPAPGPCGRDRRMGVRHAGGRRRAVRPAGGAARLVRRHPRGGPDQAGPRRSFSIPPRTACRVRRRTPGASCRRGRAT